MKWFHSEIRLIKNGNVYPSPVSIHTCCNKKLKLSYIYTEYAWIYGTFPASYKSPFNTWRWKGILCRHNHYDDVIMSAIASQIISLTIVYSTVYSDADQRKHQSCASLAFVRGIHRDRWIPRTKGQLRGKCFHLMTSSWLPHEMNNALSQWYDHSADKSHELPDLHTTQTQKSEVYASMVTEWPPACLHKLPPRRHQKATEENLEWKMFST